MTSFTTIIKKTHFPESSEIEVIDGNGTRIIFYAYSTSNELPAFSPTPTSIEQFKDMYDHGRRYYITQTVTNKTKVAFLLGKEEFRKRYVLFDSNILKLILEYI